MEKLAKNPKPVKKTALTGQDSPLTVSFEMLRSRALNTPVLNGFEDIRIKENKLHTKAISFSSNYWLLIGIVAVLQDGKFFWYVEASLGSKIDGRKINLLVETDRTRNEVKLSNAEALGGVGIQSETTIQKFKDKYVWKTPFAENDYSKLFPAFKDLLKETFEK